MDLIKIGKFIAFCRKDKKLTQEELAEKLYITDRAVSKWERGLSLPDASIMLELCNILDINVNELLMGEKIMKENYKEKTESLLVDLAKQDEMKNRKIMSLTIVASILSVISYSIIVIISALAFGEGTIFGIIMVLSTMIFVGSAFLIFKYEVETGYHACKNCNYKFVPTYMGAMLAPHIGYTRYLKCPKCNKRSWAKKVMTK